MMQSDPLWRRLFLPAMAGYCWLAAGSMAMAQGPAGPLPAVAPAVQYAVSYAFVLLIVALALVFVFRSAKRKGEEKKEEYQPTMMALHQQGAAPGPGGPGYPGAPGLGAGGFAPQAGQTHGSAVTLLVMAIVGLVFCTIIIEPIVLIQAAKAKKEIRSNPGLSGEGLVLAAQIIAGIALLGIVLQLIIIIPMMAAGE